MKNLLVMTIMFKSVILLANDLEVEITSLTNIRGNGAMEACGFVKNQEEKTSLVTLVHDESYYTTLTNEEGKWCQVIKRWNFNGNTAAQAKSLF